MTPSSSESRVRTCAGAAVMALNTVIVAQMGRTGAVGVGVRGSGR